MADSDSDSGSDQYASMDSDEMSSSGDESVSEATEGSRSVVDRVAKARERTPGVVYLSRIPPFMKPHKLKHLLVPYGNVGRVYLQPEGEW